MRTHILKIGLLITILTVLSLDYGTETIAEISVTYKLTGEITNLNPYSIFVAVPSNITFEEKTLPKPKNSLDVSISSKQTPGNITYETIFNGKKGYWIPPYTTLKITIYHYDPITYDIKVDESQDNYDIVGPAVVDKVSVIDLNKLFKNAKYEGIKIGDFTLYVSGYIIKGNDTESLSIIVPAPMVINNYDNIYEFGEDTSIWIPSYDSWYKSMLEREGIKVSNNDPLNPNMDDALAGNDESLFNFKVFDVPAMAFTTSSTHPLDFYYIVYKYNNNQ